MSNDDHIATALAKGVNPLVTIFSFTLVGFVIMRSFHLEGIWAALTLFFFSILGLVFAVLDPFLRSRNVKPAVNPVKKKPIDEEKLREFLKSLDEDNTGGMK